MENKSTLSVSTKLSPAEIKNKDFKKVIRGYSPQEVVEFLDDVARTWEKVQKNEKALLKTIQSLNEEIEKWKTREFEIEQKKEKAQLEIGEIRTRASKEEARMLQEVEERASGVRRGTEEWLVKLIHELEETQRRKNSFITAFKASLDSHYKILRSQEEEESLGVELMHFLNNKENKEINA